MYAMIVEDERRIAASVKRGLENEGYAVDVVSTGRETLDWVGGRRFDAIVVLNLPLPEFDGLTVCRELSIRGARTPILTLTARDGVDVGDAGLDADDCLIKPFALKELLARLQALAWRGDERPRTAVLQIVVAASRARHPRQRASRGVAGISTR